MYPELFVFMTSYIPVGFYASHSLALIYQVMWCIPIFSPPGSRRLLSLLIWSLVDKFPTGSQLIFFSGLSSRSDHHCGLLVLMSVSLHQSKKSCQLYDEPGAEAKIQ